MRCRASLALRRYRVSVASPSGGRSWWAHFDFTRINTTPTFLCKKIEDLRQVRASRSIAVGHALNEGLAAQLRTLGGEVARAAGHFASGRLTTPEVSQAEAAFQPVSDAEGRRAPKPATIGPRAIGATPPCALISR